MELLKDPRTLQRAVSLASRTQSARSAMLVKQAQSARDLLGMASGMKRKDLKSALKTGITALMTAGDDGEQDQPKTVHFDDKHQQDQPKAVRLNQEHLCVGSVAVHGASEYLMCVVSCHFLFVNVPSRKAQAARQNMFPAGRVSVDGERNLLFFSLLLFLGHDHGFSGLPSYGCSSGSRFHHL